MAGASDGYRAALVTRRLTPGLISSLLRTGGLPPSICFSTSYSRIFGLRRKVITGQRAGPKA